MHNLLVLSLKADWMSHVFEAMKYKQYAHISQV